MRLAIFLGLVLVAKAIDSSTFSKTGDVIPWLIMIFGAIDLIEFLVNLTKSNKS